MERNPIVRKFIEQFAVEFARDMEDQAQTLYSMGFAPTELVAVIPERGRPYVTVKPPEDVGTFLVENPEG